MKDGFRVIDSDRHIMEPSDVYDRYMPEKFRGRVKITGPNQSGRYVDGKPVSDSERRPDREVTDHGFIFAANKAWRDTFAEAISTGFDPPSNIRDMDREGDRSQRPVPDHGPLRHVALGHRPRAERGHLPCLQHLALGVLRLR